MENETTTAPPAPSDGSPRAVYALPIAGHAHKVRVAAFILPSGQPGLFRTRDRGGSYHGIELFGIGIGGAVLPLAVVGPREAREIAFALLTEAERLDEAKRR